MNVTGTPGTGTITLNAATSGHQTFASGGIADKDVVSYHAVDGTLWEIGRGQYTSSGTTLARGLIASSSGSLVSLTSAAIISVVALAEDLFLCDTLLVQPAIDQTVNPNCSVNPVGYYEIPSSHYCELMSGAVMNIS
jgi:hypothetical protein